MWAWAQAQARVVVVGAGAQDGAGGWGRGAQVRRGTEEGPASRVDSGPKVWARVVSALWVKITAGQGESGCTLTSNAARQGKLDGR